MFNTKDTIRALRILGFSIRQPDAGRKAYCIHTISKEEVWLETDNDKQMDGVLEYRFKRVTLPMKYFKAVYMGLKTEKTYPSNQH